VERADVIHGHGFYVYTNWLLGRAACGQGKPLIYHPHGMFEPWILSRSRWKKCVVHWLFEDRNMRSCRLWRALTPKEADQIRAQGIKAPIVVAPNGVRLEEYSHEAGQASSAELPLMERVRARKKLVFMARVHPKKGLDILLRVWASLNGRRKHWELLIAGPDEDGYQTTVEKIIRDLDLSASTTFLGPVTGPTKRALLHSADLFVLCSRSEGLPVAVLEAMACGCPVVVTRACNIPEILPEGAGWLCEPETESVSTALREALECSDSERRQRGRAARALVERHYAWPSIASTILDACQRYCT
jgi:glycosyltransferase involved in cell wall biosynthesis